MIYTKQIPNNILGTLNLTQSTRNVLTENDRLNTWFTYLNAEGSNPIIIPVDDLDGYQETPERYWVRCNTPRVCVFVKADIDNPTQRFEWSSENSSDKIVLTANITDDSLVFLQIEGDKLSYDSGNKLLFIVCDPTYIHPITILFEDNFGVPQTIKLETGAWSSSFNSTNTFKSLSRDVEFVLEKTATNVLTVGDNFIPRELMLFLDGFMKSKSHFVVGVSGLTNKTELIETSLVNPQLVANSFTKSYSITGTLMFNTNDVSKLFYDYGEINLS